MAKFRKRPVVVEAVRWEGWDSRIIPSPIGEAPEWLRQHIKTYVDEVGGDNITVTTPHGWATVRPGDWILQDADGLVYSCKPDIFEATYEPVEESNGK